ncbi:signal recognition particle-docking protein FtsY, partial [Halorubrum sp. E3]
MFDGLKDKLSGFREDVEENAEVEEPAERDEAAADESAAPEDSGGEQPAASETAPAGSPAEDAAADDEDGDNEPSTFQRAKAFATGRIIIEEEDLEQPLWDLEMALLESDVEMSVAERILDTVREKMLGESRKQVETTGELVESALHDALLDVIAVGQFDFEERIAEADKPVTIVFTGVNGVGKTTSIAKLSEWLADRGYSSVMANGDTYRAGANEQIQEHADRLDRELISHDQGGDPAAVIYDGVEYA